MVEDIVRVLRIVEYVGPRNWVEATVNNSIHGERRINTNSVIKAATIGSYPEILELGNGQSKNNPDDADQSQVAGEHQRS
jgi:hypothetical protein